MKMVKKLVAVFLVILLVIGILDNNVVHAGQNARIPKEESVNHSRTDSADADYQVKWMLGGSWATGHNMTVTIARYCWGTKLYWQLAFMTTNARMDLSVAIFMPQTQNCAYIKMRN